MSDRDTGNRPLVSLPQAAEYLQLPVEAVRALVGARYLEPAREGSEGPLFPLGDLKAFLARNADSGSGNLVVETELPDPQALLAALRRETEAMARQAFEIFASVFPEAAAWSAEEQAHFVDQAQGRFDAILSVIALGSELDDALVDDLREVGAAAAWDGSPLPQLLVVLRISRDLVVQTAAALAEERGGRWGLSLSLLLTRVLPAMDRLTDALANGYWAAILGRQEEANARYEHVVEHSSDGIFEVGLDGTIHYANASLALVLGHRLSDLEGAPLASVLIPLDGRTPIDVVPADPGAGSRQVEVTVLRADGVRRVLDIRTMARIHDGELVGFHGVVRDVTTAHDLLADKNESLSLVTGHLRGPISTIMGLGATLESHGGDVGGEEVARIGATVRHQGERLARTADELAVISRVETDTLALTPAPVALARLVRSALRARAPGPGGLLVSVPEGMTVMADARRLEQVISDLVDNAFEHGSPPVAVTVEGVADGRLELAVTDHGAGVAPHLLGTLFSRHRPLAWPEGDRGARPGLGLAVARGLVEAMGGRIWYESAAHGGASFHLTLPVPKRRLEDEPIRI